MTFQTRALDLARAFTEGVRSDGSTFFYVPETKPAWMLDAVRSAHHEEFPNDWRFSMCRQLAYAMAEHENVDDVREAALDIASDAATPYHAELLRWYADQPRRLCYADDWATDYGADAADSISGHLMAGQAYCIEQMLHGLIDACEAAQAAMVAHA